MAACDFNLQMMALSDIAKGLGLSSTQVGQLCIVRALASGLAYTELAISITLVNESLPSDRRGALLFDRAGWLTVGCDVCRNHLSGEH